MVALLLKGAAPQTGGGGVTVSGTVAVCAGIVIVVPVALVVTWAWMLIVCVEAAAMPIPKSIRRVSRIMVE